MQHVYIALEEEVSARTDDLAHSDLSLKQMQLRRATLQWQVCSTLDRTNESGTWAHLWQEPFTAQANGCGSGVQGKSSVPYLSDPVLAKRGTTTQFPGINTLCCTQPFISRSGNNPEADFMSSFLFRKSDCATLGVLTLGHEQPGREDHVSYLISLIIRVRMGFVPVCNQNFLFLNFRDDQKMENIFQNYVLSKMFPSFF